MGADRRIDPAAGFFGLVDDVVQPLAHAVQALEFVGLTGAGHIKDRRDGVGVVGGELRIDPVGHSQQFAGVGDVADVGGFLAGEDREIGQAQHLGAFHLGVPIGAFHQPDHDLAIQPCGKVMQPVERGCRAAAVSLHDNAKAVPALQVGVRQNRLDDFQRQGQAIGFLGVDVEAHAGAGGLAGQIAHHRHQFGHDPRVLCHLVARVQGGKLDRDAGVGADVVAAAGVGDAVDGGAVGFGVADRVRGGFRRLAQHVVGIGVAIGFKLGGAGHRGPDGFAQHELLAHFLHGALHRQTDHRFAQAADGGAQVADHARRAFVQHLAGQHQRPGRGIDQGRGGLAQMAAPVRRCDLVFDQAVDGVGVGHPEQRLGQAHQGDAFVGRQPVFGQKHLHQPRSHIGTDQAHQIGATRGNAGAAGAVHLGLADQPIQQRGFGGQRAGVDGVPKIGCRRGHGILLIWPVIPFVFQSIFL